MSRGRIIGLILGIGFALLLLALFKGCRGDTADHSTGEVREEVQEQPERRWAV